jgi:hypothetical protein
MTHLFRPTEPPLGTSPPVGTWARFPWAVAAGRVLNCSARLLQATGPRRLLCILLMLLGLVVQAVMLLVAAYLVDLSVSLMELWAELARRHLEITLS